MGCWTIRHRLADGEWKDTPVRWATRNQACSAALNWCNTGDADEADVIEDERGLTDRWRRRPGLARRFDRTRLVEGD